MTITTTPAIPALVQQKLEAFERLQPEFEACFQFVQDVHGQQRFASFPVAFTVRYLHSLWICEHKSRLLSVFQTIKEYEGKTCLELLRHWQGDENTADVVAFLQRKLDMLPFADLTRQVQAARYARTDDGLASRLMHGRAVLLNRGVNLMMALDALFALPQEELLQQVRTACEQYGHTPDQIARQLQEEDSPLYSYVPHQMLAQRNMRVMNALGVNVLRKPADLPGQRTWRVVPSTEPLSPFAEQVVSGYIELTAPLHNNLKVDPFIDRPEQSHSGTV
jgi:hypothetical protein